MSAWTDLNEVLAEEEEEEEEEEGREEGEEEPLFADDLEDDPPPLPPPVVPPPPSSQLKRTRVSVLAQPPAMEAIYTCINNRVSPPLITEGAWQHFQLHILMIKHHLRRRGSQF